MILCVLFLVVVLILVSLLLLLLAFVVGIVCLRVVSFLGLYHGCFTPSSSSSGCSCCHAAGVALVVDVALLGLDVVTAVDDWWSCSSCSCCCGWCCGCC